MKYVIDSSIAARWCLTNPDFAKAHKLRIDFHMGISELLAPDIFPPDCAELFVKAERKGDIPPGDAAIGVDDLLLVVNGVVRSFNQPAKSALLPQIVAAPIFAINVVGDDAQGPRLGANGGYGENRQHQTHGTNQLSQAAGKPTLRL